MKLISNMATANGSWSQGRYFESRAQISKAGAEFMPPGARNTGAPRGWIF